MITLHKKKDGIMLRLHSGETRYLVWWERVALSLNCKWVIREFMDLYSK